MLKETDDVWEHINLGPDTVIAAMLIMFLIIVCC